MPNEMHCQSCGMPMTEDSHFSKSKVQQLEEEKLWLRT